MMLDLLTEKFRTFTNVNKNAASPIEPLLIGNLAGWLHLQQLHQQFPDKYQWLKIEELQQLIANATAEVRCYIDKQTDLSSYKTIFNKFAEHLQLERHGMTAAEDRQFWEYELQQEPYTLWTFTELRYIASLHNLDHIGKLVDSNLAFNYYQFPQAQDNLEQGFFHLNTDIFQLVDGELKVNVGEFFIDQSASDSVIEAQLLIQLFGNLLHACVIGMRPSPATQDYFAALAKDEQRLCKFLELFYISHYRDNNQQEQAVYDKALKMLAIKMNNVDIPVVPLMQLSLAKCDKDYPHFKIPIPLPYKPKKKTKITAPHEEAPETQEKKVKELSLAFETAFTPTVEADIGSAKSKVPDENDAATTPSVESSSQKVSNPDSRRKSQKLARNKKVPVTPCYFDSSPSKGIEVFIENTRTRISQTSGMLHDVYKEFPCDVAKNIAKEWKEINDSQNVLEKKLEELEFYNKNNEISHNHKIQETKQRKAIRIALSVYNNCPEQLRRIKKIQLQRFEELEKIKKGLLNLASEAKDFLDNSALSADNIQRTKKIIHRATTEYAQASLKDIDSPAKTLNAQRHLFNQLKNAQSKTSVDSAPIPDQKENRKVKPTRINNTFTPANFINRVESLANTHSTQIKAFIASCGFFGTLRFYQQNTFPPLPLNISPPNMAKIFIGITALLLPILRDRLQALDAREFDVTIFSILTLTACMGGVMLTVPSLIKYTQNQFPDPEQPASDDDIAHVLVYAAFLPICAYAVYLSCFATKTPANPEVRSSNIPR
jgi:hypothetical protein